MYACHVEQCPRAFTLGSTYSSFLSHAARKHPNWKELLDQAPPITRPKLNQFSHNSSASFLEHESQSEVESSIDQQDDGNDPMDFSTPEWPTDSSDDGISDARKAAGRFLLGLKERYRLSQAAVDFTVGAVNQIISIVHEDLKKSITRSLNNMGVPITDIDDLFNPEDIFEGLETEYQQTKFYKDHFGLVVYVA
jgi:hypothetical protein